MLKLLLLKFPDMPGDNFSVVLCGISRRQAGHGIFQVPSKKKVGWRSEFINAITKTRVVDAEFRNIIKNDRVFACYRHFKESEIKIRKLTAFLHRLHYSIYNPILYLPCMNEMTKITPFSGMFKQKKRFYRRLLDN